MSKVFLLGAGFTHDISGGKFPLMGELDKEIAEKVDEDLRERYGFGRNVFESCLTRLEIDLYHTFTEP